MVEDTGELIGNPAIDTLCDSDDVNEILSEIQGKDKLNVRADAFAQLAMIYEG